MNSFQIKQTTTNTIDPNVSISHINNRLMIAADSTPINDLYVLPNNGIPHTI